MRPPLGRNWIAGAWCEASCGSRFELNSLLPPHGVRGRWVRSARSELEQALAASAAAQAGWARRSPAERARVLLRVVEALERDDELAGELGAALGLEAAATGERLEADLHRAREGLEILSESGESRRGTGLFVAHWSDLVGPLLLRLGPWLVGGSTCVVLTDRRLPEAGVGLARALDPAGLPPGVICVLHDDGRTVLRAALSRPGLAWVRCRGTRAELEELGCRRDSRAFGAGLTEWSLWPLSSAVHVVTEGCDPAVEAERVMERSLAPSATLCGQLPDAVGRVLCHQRRFSRFTEELLGRLDAATALQRPFVPVEADLPAWMGEAWALGLDEGACPILGEAPAEASRGLGSSAAAVRALVFTNVETGGRLLRLDRPAPLLRLARVGSDEEALRLRDELAPGAGPARLD